MTRALLRFIQHRIQQDTSRGVTFEAFCSIVNCWASSGPMEETEAAQDWAMQHTGRTGHDEFKRVYIDHAKVTREE